MSWSYSGDPNTTDKDFIRFTVGDTIADDPLLQDEEILSTISSTNNRDAAAVKCCEALVSLFARKCDRKLGPQSISANQQYEHFVQLRDNLRKHAATFNAPYAGGLSEQERIEDAMNPDLKPPIFGRNMMTNDEAGYPYNVK
jgi:hypothetical protein